MTTRRRRYASVTPELVAALLAYCLPVPDGGGGEGNGETDLSLTLLQDILKQLPHGSVKEAWLEAPNTGTHEKAPSWQPEDGPRVAFRIQGFGPLANKEDGVRWSDPPALPALIAFGLYAGSPVLKDNGKGNHYGDIGVAECRTAITRLLTGAKPGQRVKLADNHRDLRLSRLALAHGASHASGGREDRGQEYAIEHSMSLYHAAVSRGERVVLTETAYRALLEATLRRLDAHYKVGPLTAGATSAADHVDDEEG